MKRRLLLVCTCILMLLCCVCQAQRDSIVLIGKFSSRYANKVEEKATKVEEGLTKQSKKALQRLQKQQQKVYKSLYKIDSNAAKAYLQNCGQQYDKVISKLEGTSSNAVQRVQTYIPGLDSMTGALKYLNKIGADKLPGKEKIAEALAATGGAGKALDGAKEVKKLMQQQEEQLKALAARYKDLDVAKQLKAYNKELYYYSQRIQNAKQMLNDPSKLEGEVLKLLQRNTAFRSWMQQNGQLAQMFGGVGSGSADYLAQNLAGLQTRLSVQQGLQSRFGGSLSQAQQMLTSQVQAAQGQLSSMRNQLQQLGSGSFGNGSTSDMVMPQFKPNNQKTKTLLQRLEYGFSMQSSGKNRWLPATTDIGLSLGYKLNDKSVVGLGAAYKLGWGQPISHIRISHQGIGLRSYVDYKLKGSLWLSGGYEQNFRSAFNSIEELQNISAWQQSGLIGLNKKIKQGKRTIETKLLWDFLSYQQVPRTQTILFRIEYKLK